MIKKLIFFILSYLVIISPADAATWYAQKGSCNIDSVSGGTSSDVWNSVSVGGGTWLDWSTGPATDDIFEANAQTGLVINTDPKGTSGATKVHLKNTGGGGFTSTTSVTPITITADGTAVGAALLVISGTANANPCLTIAGDTTWTGGDGSSEYAISDTHTVGTVVFGSSGHPVVVIAGSNSSAYGYYTATVSPASGYVQATGVSAVGWMNNGGVGHSLIGVCTGSGTSVSAPGCFAAHSSSFINFTGNIISGGKSVGAQGAIRYTQIAPALGVTGNYVKYDGGGTPVYCGSNTDDTSKALSTFFYIDPTDGTSVQGAATSGGGHGAWLN